METYDLYLIVTPGLEALAAREIEQKIPLSELRVSKGGIEVKAPLKWISDAHHALRIPTRILLRLQSFRVKDFPKLHQKFQSLRWTEFLSHPRPRLKITSHRSRLKHTGKIEETILGALAESLTAQPLSLDWKKKNFDPQTLFIRIDEDELTLSLDLTGEPLYKRGVQTLKGEAPLRESIAAALLLELFDGISSPLPLVDPMCGSGTFLTEARDYHRPLYERKFSFEESPLFRGQHYKKLSETQPFPVSKLLGFDVNGADLQRIWDGVEEVEFEARDSLDGELLPGDKLMIVNPPYGERIRTPGPRGSFLRSAWQKFLTVDRPLRFGWILPSDMNDLFSNAPKGYSLLRKLSLKNGGLSVTFWLWEREA